MKPATLIAAAMLFQTIAGQSPNPPSGGAIEGIVVRIGTGEPIAEAKTGTIAGTVIDFQGQPVRVVQAILIPDEHRDRSDLYRTATTDEAGRVTLTGVAPGNYKLFAWEALEQYAYYDPQVLDLFERQGTPVHISESSTASAEVKMIPAK